MPFSLNAEYQRFTFVRFFSSLSQSTLALGFDFNKCIKFSRVNIFGMLFSVKIKLANFVCANDIQKVIRQNQINDGILNTLKVQMVLVDGLFIPST